MRTLWFLSLLPFVLSFSFALLGCSERQSAMDAVAQRASQQPSPSYESLPASGEPLAHYVSAPAPQEKASLKLKVVLDGAIPKREKLKVNGALCGNLNILAEDMIVAQNGAIQNFVLYFDARRNKLKLPKFQVPAKQVALDNNKCVFEPHVISVMAGQKFVVTNNDNEGHNANFAFFSNPIQNPLIPAKGQKPIDVAKSESTPIPVSCNIHPWMKAYVIVFDHPYVGISDAKGEIEIKDLPVGKLTFKLWHENADRSITSGRLNGKPAKWRRGNVEIDLEPGVNDLGTLSIPADQFKK